MSQMRKPQGWTVAEMVKASSLLDYLTGAEGEGEGSGTQPPAGDGGQEPPAPPVAGSDDKGDDKPTVYDQAYVDGLRAENAKHRTRNKELEDEKAEREKAEMSEAERAKAEAAEEKTKRETAESQLLDERKRNAVLAEAGKSKFKDPNDALAFVDLAEITMNQDGTPHKGQVEAAVKKVAEARAYLIGGAGSADGGPKGASPQADADWLKEQQADIAARGGIPVSL